ncbi:hypothetical protein [Undibacterium amnicola]|uniref:hypothetical protein n=1 Tax=Undibacterium amnicola TaxID=1834038 RepID=UPI001FE84E45|nr:hypothetical protein [Undibacterium amnicola]
MARYKHIDRNPRFIPVVLDAQLMTGSFEYALDYLIDHELDLSRFDVHYKNDDTGAPAYAPSVLLKIVLHNSKLRKQNIAIYLKILFLTRTTIGAFVQQGKRCTATVVDALSAAGCITDSRATKPTARAAHNAKDVYVHLIKPR